MVRRLTNEAPTKLADSWDNVGLLAQAPAPRSHGSVFLAIDLSPAVADELLERGDISVAVVYHPVIFRPVKSITMADPLQRSILRCIAAGIHLYCPHTTLDACRGGINDWLVAGLTHAWETAPPERGDLLGATLAAQGRVVCPSERDASVGVGRATTLVAPCTFEVLVQRAKALLQVPYVQVARAPGVAADTFVHSIAVCAGSGGSVLRACTDVDVWVTGEMGHHEVLAANARGVSVILANHTNTERRYLADVLQPRLAADLQVGVHVSQVDADPLQVL
ncbi:hypothetical protein MCAP1_000435 [Malassezia caprae]|uniref:Uncharacterized protein n=1 Tax=Malassezia caprae TaxID=1381934 RepID=A0AAF0E4W5_9BASI|nr:hypothetical protein MCAP1_000435 [Malassezia caprae]